MYVSSSEGEPQEFAVIGFNYVAFGRVNDQFQPVLQELADTMKYTFARPFTLYQYRKVVCIRANW